VCCALAKRGRSGLPQSIPAPRLKQSRAPGPGRGVPVPCSGGRDGSLPPAGNGPVGRGTCARPGLGALVADSLPGGGRLPKLPQSPQPLHELFIGDLARRMRGGSRTETALAGQQVMLAAFVHGGEDTTKPMTSCHYHSLAFRMRPLSAFTGPELGSSLDPLVLRESIVKNEQLRAKRQLRGWSQDDLVRELVDLG